MKIVRYENPLFNDLDRFLKLAVPTVGRCAQGRESAQLPEVEYYEEDAAYVIQLPIPGIEKEQIELNLDRDVLSLSAKSSEESEGARRQYAYSRSFSVPENVDADAITAQLENGILTVQLPKSKGVDKKRIAVN